MIPRHAEREFEIAGQRRYSGGTTPHKTGPDAERLTPAGPYPRSTGGFVTISPHVRPQNSGAR